MVRGEFAHQGFQEDESTRQQEKLAWIVYSVPATGMQQRLERIPD